MARLPSVAARDELRRRHAGVEPLHQVVGSYSTPIGFRSNAGVFNQS